MVVRSEDMTMLSGELRDERENAFMASDILIIRRLAFVVTLLLAPQTHPWWARRLDDSVGGSGGVAGERTGAAAGGVRSHMTGILPQAAITINNASLML